MTIIADTSGILVLLDITAREHEATQEAVGESELIISPLVLAEIDYMISRRDPPDALVFARDVRDGVYTLAVWDGDDHATSVDVVSTYLDMNIGLADASNVTLAQKYQTERILTFDQHYRAIRPLDGADAFTILPADKD